MKTSLLTIFILSATAQFAFSQNVRIIHASERSTVSNSVIIPTPPKTRDTSAALNKNVPAGATSSQTVKTSNVKSVRGSSCKKPCIKKAFSDKVTTKRAGRTKQVETTKK